MERRGYACYAQAKFFINRVLRHEKESRQNDFHLPDVCCLRLALYVPTLSLHKTSVRGTVGISHRLGAALF